MAAVEEFFYSHLGIVVAPLLILRSLESDTKALKIETLVCTKSSQFSMLQ